VFAIYRDKKVVSVSLVRFHYALQWGKELKVTGEEKYGSISLIVQEETESYLKFKWICKHGSSF
jgi:hypothetical protein